MTKIDRVFAAAAAVCEEATRRGFGDEPDTRFDIPLAILLDLDETLSADLPSTNDSATASTRNGSDGQRGSYASPEGAMRALGGEAA